MHRDYQCRCPNESRRRCLVRNPLRASSVVLGVLRGEKAVSPPACRCRPPPWIGPPVRTKIKRQRNLGHYIQKPPPPTAAPAPNRPTKSEGTIAKTPPHHPRSSAVPNWPRTLRRDVFQQTKTGKPRMNANERGWCPGGTGTLWCSPRSPAARPHPLPRSA